MFKSDVDYLECKREVVTSLTAKDEHLVKGYFILLPDYAFRRFIILRFYGITINSAYRCYGSC